MCVSTSGRSLVQSDVIQLLEDVLVRPQHALAKQVNDHYLPKLFHHEIGMTDEQVRADIKARNIFFNQDGTGVGFYSWARDEYTEAVGPRPQLYKTIQPPLNDQNFASLCANTSTLTVLAHIRMATSVVHAFNNHPFAFGRHLFMHNGSVANFTAIQRDMCALMSPKAFANIHGSTDTEHVAALYMSNLGDEWETTYPLAHMKEALDKTIGTIIRLQRKLLPKEERDEANSLNLCTTDGAKLVACRFRNHPTEQPPSLYYSTAAGSTLNRKYPGHPDDPEGMLNTDVGDGMKRTEEHGNHVIVASEPTTFQPSEWSLIGERCSLFLLNAI